MEGGPPADPPRPAGGSAGARGRAPAAISDGTGVPATVARTAQQPPCSQGDEQQRQAGGEDAEHHGQGDAGDSQEQTENQSDHAEGTGNEGGRDDGRDGAT